MATAAMGNNRRTALSLLAVSGRMINEAVSFVVFVLLDLLDFILCFVFKIADFLMEAEWGPCYCSSSAKEAVTKSGKILVSEKGGESKIVCLSTWSTKLQLEDVSDTLYRRPYLVSEVSKSTVNEFRRLKHLDQPAASTTTTTTMTTIQSSSPIETKKTSTGCYYHKNGTTTVRSTFTVNSTIVEMLQGKIGGHQPQLGPRWSDYNKGATTEDVLFIHGFISSSKFWTETVFPNLSSSAKSKYRLLAVDLLGFGRSPKPADSLYTLREHVEMIERSVLDQYKVKSFHIVAHSLGCIIALALAVKHPSSVKSLTLLAPPYFPVPKGEQATQYVMRRVAPRRVWPPIAMGASIACWYEHISRTAVLLISKNHRFLEFLLRLLTRNRLRTYLVEVFFCHTHNAAWHTLHNIICGTAGKLEGYLDAVRERLSCPVTVFHGRDDELLPVECSTSLQLRIPRATVNVIDKTDHITIVVGRQEAFARELEHIWSITSSSSP
ncbi:putative lysophospholipase BODYGUARD 3 [Drosera capensis]